MKKSSASEKLSLKIKAIVEKLKSMREQLKNLKAKEKEAKAQKKNKKATSKIVSTKKSKSKRGRSPKKK